MRTFADYYAILGLSKDASAEVINYRYHELFNKFHPDVCLDEKASQKLSFIVKAYTILMDETVRSIYDLEYDEHVIKVSNLRALKPCYNGKNSNGKNLSEITSGVLKNLNYFLLCKEMIIENLKKDFIRYNVKVKEWIIMAYKYKKRLEKLYSLYISSSLDTNILEKKMYDLNNSITELELICDVINLDSSLKFSKSNVKVKS